MYYIQKEMAVMFDNIKIKIDSVLGLVLVEPTGPVYNRSRSF